jgi:hypothetical protein
MLLLVRDEEVGCVGKWKVKRNDYRNCHGSCDRDAATTDFESYLLS